MPEFNVTVVTTIVVAATVEINAKDDDAAQTKVQSMIDKGKFAITWEKTKTASEEIDFEEQEQTTEIDECNKS